MRRQEPASKPALIGWSGRLLTKILKSTSSMATAAARHRIKSDTSSLSSHSSSDPKRRRRGPGNASLPSCVSGCRISLSLWSYKPSPRIWRLDPAASTMYLRSVAGLSASWTAIVATNLRVDARSPPPFEKKKLAPRCSFLLYSRAIVRATVDLPVPAIPSSQYMCLPSHPSAHLLIRARASRRVLSRHEGICCLFAASKNASDRLSRRSSDRSWDVCQQG